MIPKVRDTSHNASTFLRGVARFFSFLSLYLCHSLRSHPLPPKRAMRNIRTFDRHLPNRLFLSLSPLPFYFIFALPRFSFLLCSLYAAAMPLLLLHFPRLFLPNFFLRAPFSVVVVRTLIHRAAPRRLRSFLALRFSVHSRLAAANTWLFSLLSSLFSFYF